MAAPARPAPPAAPVTASRRVTPHHQGQTMTDQILRRAPRLAVFDELSTGAAAPTWLRDGVVGAWGFAADATVTLITVSANATFLVSEHGTPTAVTRVARPGSTSDALALESELTWVAALAADGVARVPTGLTTAAGTYVATVRDAAGTGWACVSFAYIPGDVLEDVADPVPFYAEIGRTTAALHEHAARWRPPSPFRRHSWTVPDMLGESARWGRWEDAHLAPGETALLDRAQAAALDVLVDAKPGGPGWGLIHADLRPSNVMTDGLTLTVIDFDDCGYGWFGYDFAAALTFVEHVPHAPEMATEWLAGYEQVRPLTAEDLHRACALSMLRRLQVLGRATTHPQGALLPELRAEQVSGTVEVAQRYLRRRTWLIS